MATTATATVTRIVLTYRRVFHVPTVQTRGYSAEAGARRRQGGTPPAREGAPPGYEREAILGNVSERNRRKSLNPTGGFPLPASCVTPVDASLFFSKGVGWRQNSWGAKTYMQTHRGRGRCSEVLPRDIC